MKFIFKLLIVLLSYYWLGIIGAIVAVIAVFAFNSRSKVPIQLTKLLWAQRNFFNALFTVMGYVAKADGWVSEREIHAARTIMQQMGLSEQKKKRAIDLFNRGKQADFNLGATLKTLKQHTHHTYRYKFFVNIQVQAAYAAGQLTLEKKQLLQFIAMQLNCPPINFADFEETVYNRYNKHSQNNNVSQDVSLTAAYRELAISPTANEVEIKRAYRSLMSQYHPDKLVAKGSSADTIKTATEKTQRLQKAYKKIKETRGL